MADPILMPGEYGGLICDCAMCDPEPADDLTDEERTAQEDAAWDEHARRRGVL